MTPKPAITMIGALSFVVVTMPGCVFTDPTSYTNKWSSQGYSCSFVMLDPIKQLDPESITVTVYDSKNHAVSGAIVSLDLLMPSMSMPKNSTMLPQIEDGLYRGDVRFTMAGQWNVRVAVTVDGKVVTDHIVPVTVH